MRIFLLLSFSMFCFFAQAQNLNADTGRIKNIKLHKKGNDHVDLALDFEINRTKDPVTGKVPRELLAEANRKAEVSQKQRRNSAGRATAALSWTERGSNSDAVGSSNGNTRANGAVTSGRMRAIWPDLSDATGNTVWVGGVDGGLWKTTNITASPATWTVVNDYLSNLSVSGICQDPTNTSILYFCTGESFGNADAVFGNGVYKSIDGGVTWNQLSSTITYTKCTKILCDASGNVFLSTVGNGILRSVNGGTSWTTITPTGLSSSVPDFEISSTGRMHVYCGLSSSTNGYRFTNTPSTVTTSGWTAATTAFTVPASSSRIELACSGAVLYAAISNSNAIVTSVGKSIDEGVTWTTTTLTTTANQALNGTNASSQAWYCLTAGIDPSNSNNAMLGNLNIISTTDGGTTWVKGSEWVGTSGQYVHADQHAIVWYNNGNKLLFGTDGGIHFSSDKGVTIRDRNVGLRIKQFYSVAIHPSSTNYFLAGAQDNGNHQFSNAGLSSSVEVTGGDGAYVAIDQDQAQYQFGAYVYSAYRRSVNSGTNWGSINFYKGTSPGTNFGSFINPFAYDNANNIIYAGAGGGEIFRWTTPQTTATGNYYLTDGFPTGATILTGITNLSGQQVSAVRVSPYTANRVYFGTTGGKLIYLDNAHTAASATAGTIITGASFPAGNISSINHGTNEQNLIVCFSNYNVSNVWVSTNGGTSWTAIDGNLPNMPVRWVMFYPNDNTKAIIATEAGIWETDLINGASTVWTANPTFPVVRTDMLQYRSSDGTIAAATHGRGLFTTIASSCSTTPTIAVSPTTSNYCSPGGVAVNLTATGGLTYAWSPSAGLSSTSGATVTASPSTTTTYTVTGFDVNGCSANANTTITVTASPVVTTSATPSSVCTGGNSIIAADVSSGTLIYCQPTYSSGTGSGDFIAQVSVAGTTLSNVTTGAANPYYTLYPTSGSTTGTLTANNLYTMTVKGGTFSTCFIRGWIDYNNDGNFDATETIGISANVGASATGNFTFTIPLTAFNGTTRLRMRSSDTSPGPGTGDFCGTTNSNWGETEDYTITITGGTNKFAITWSPSTYLSSTTTNPTTASNIAGNITYTVSASYSGCTTTAQITVTATSVSAPTGTNGQRCGSGTVTISAASSGNVIDWYAASTGGIALVTGNNSFTTPSIAVTTIYYAESRNATTGCISPTRTAVTATINATPSFPTGTDGSRCGTGTVALSASSSGNVIDWYAASSGGTALISASNSYTTPSISATTIYYAESRNATTGCVSTTRTAVTATINTNSSITGTNGQRCGPGIVVISAASSGNVIDWYAAASGGTALVSASNSYTTPSIAATTIFYAESRNISTGCISPTRTAVTATINANPSSPAGTGVQRCGAGTVTLSASSAGNVIDWYAVSSGGTVLSSASNSYTTPSISLTTTYYAESRNVTSGCVSSTRTALNATINTNPSSPAGTDGSRCGSGTVFLSASSSGNVIDWYAASSGGTALATGNNSFTTPSIAATTIYYAESRNVTTGCLSSSRTAVTATVNSIPSAPAGTNGQRCGTGTVSLSAISAGNIIDWYAASTGGTALLSGSNSYTTPSIAATTIYYAETRNVTSGCISSTRTAVNATVNANPSNPVINANGPTTFCNGNNVILTSTTATTYSWSNGANTQSITVTASGSYTVTITNAAGCAATSTATVVTVNPCAVTLNVKLFLQGFYSGSSNMMANLYDLGLSVNSNASDSIDVDLWSSSALNNTNPSYTQKVIVLKDGTASATFPGAVSGQRFYIAIRHRNHLETWSADSILMSTVTTYDFTNAINKAYSDGFNPPMITLGIGVYGFYAGDVNHDGAVDGADMSLVENGAAAFQFGYNPGDMTGDGATDGADLSMLENNAQLFLYYARPYQQRLILRRLFSKFKR